MKFRHITLLLLLTGCPRSEPRTLNLMLVTLDSARADHLGCYGASTGATPVIDRLASRGVLFEQVDSVVPLTLPSHATLMTGLLPQRHGMRLNGPGRLRDSVKTLAAVLSSRRYQTAAFVASPVLSRSSGLGSGFDLYDDGQAGAAGRERPAGAVAGAALQWLQRTGSKPFFLWIHFNDPHAPYDPPQPHRSRFASSPYDGEIAFADSQLGRVIDYLEAAGLRDRTVIAVVADHGEGLGQHGESTHGLLLYESTLRVPWIVAGPSLRHRRIAEAVSTTDVPPTLAALVGASMNVVRLDGRDLSSVVRGPGQPAPRDINAQTLYPGTFGWSDLTAIRRDGKKLISGRSDEVFDLDRDGQETISLVSHDPRTYRELAAALAPMRRVSSTTSADPRTKTDAFRLFEEATALAEAGKDAAAIGLLEPLVSADPPNNPFRLALADARHRTGDRLAALRLYRESVALSPQDGEAWCRMARALVDGGDPDQARTAREQCLRLNPDRAQSLRLAAPRARRGVAQGTTAVMDVLGKARIDSRPAPTRLAPAQR